MSRSLPEQIARNKRISLFYSFLLVLLLSALGAVIAAYFDLNTWPLGAVGAAALGIGMAIYTRFRGAETILQISQARTSTELEKQQFQNVAEEMAIAAGIPLPELYIIEDSAPNAFATGMTPEKGVVCVTTGLLKKLNREELQGVVAHEIAHIRNYDTRLMTTLALIAGLIPLLADFYLRLVWHGGAGRRKKSEEGNGQLIIIAIGVILALLAPTFAMLLKLAVSRQREYMADASAARFTRYPEGLASALEKLTSDPDILEASNRATAHLYIVSPRLTAGEKLSTLFSTHPPTEERIRILRGTLGSSLEPNPPQE